MVSNEPSAAETKLYQDQVRSAAGAGVPREREKVRFVSTDIECAAFLRRHLLDHSRADRRAPAPADSALHRGGRA